MKMRRQRVPAEMNDVEKGGHLLPPFASSG
jgi:hypothetical protein